MDINDGKDLVELPKFALGKEVTVQFFRIIQIHQKEIYQRDMG